MIRYEVPGRILFWGAVSAAGIAGYQWLNLDGRSDSGLRDGLAAELARRVSLDLPALPGRPKLAVAPFVNDDHGFVAQEFRTWVGRRNVQLVQPSAVEQTLEYVMPREAGHPANEINRAARLMGAGYLLCGEVRDWVTFPVESSRLEARVQLLNVETGDVVYDKISTIPEIPKRTVSTDAVPSVPHHRQLEAWDDPFLIGIVLWILAVVLLPWLFVGPIVSVLEKESNSANALMLLMLLALSAGGAWFLWGGHLEMTNGWLIVLLASVATTPYFGFAVGKMKGEG